MKTVAVPEVMLDGLHYRTDLLIEAVKHRLRTGAPFYPEPHELQAHNMRWQSECHTAEVAYMFAKDNGLLKDT